MLQWQDNEGVSGNIFLGGVLRTGLFKAACITMNYDDQIAFTLKSGTLDTPQSHFCDSGKQMYVCDAEREPLHIVRTLKP